jgi:hypothetical protein
MNGQRKLSGADGLRGCVRKRYMPERVEIGFAGAEHLELDPPDRERSPGKPVSCRPCGEVADRDGLYASRTKGLVHSLGNVE